jgi:DMSO/TMAO reductase YedYZ molybdopterin-dependent catalytic subunit
MQPMYGEAWQLGVSAALVQVLTGEFVAAIYGTHTSPLRAVGKWLIDALPTPFIDVGIALLRRADKPSIAAMLVLLNVGLPALAALGGRDALVLALLALGAIGLYALWRRTELGRPAAAVIGVLAPFAGVVGVWIGAAGSALLAATLGILALAVRSLRRRRVVRSAISLPKSQRSLPPPPPSSALDIPGLSPLMTPVERFFVTDVTFPAPAVNIERWRLTVRGRVERPLSLSFAELLALRSTEVDSVLMCVHNPVGGPFVGNARWQGVRLTELLARAGVSEQADHVRLHAVDGFSAGISLRLIEQGFEPLLVYAMNGLPLPRTHGAPVRVLVPGIHGYDANIKWLASIEVTRFDDAVDYAERKGWPRVPSRMAPNARIDVPSDSALLRSGECRVAGVAWSPPHGVVKVELRVDGGAWHPCTLATALGPSAWVHWCTTWEAAPGRHTIEVRTWGRDGVQTESPAAPYPEGARGYHCVAVDVTSRRAPRPRQLAWWLALQARARWQLAWSGFTAWRRRTR